MERPTGVTIIAWIAIIWGIIQLVWSFLVLGFSSVGWVAGLVMSQGLQNWGASAFTGAFVSIIGAVLMFVVGWGMLRLKGWAWILAVIAVIVSLIPPLITMFSGAFWLGLIGLIIPAILTYYLLSPGVRRAFGRA
ncbi:MAG: hypothetical protein U0822_13100 [Anaerolineae bacterium]